MFIDVWNNYIHDIDSMGKQILQYFLINTNTPCACTMSSA